MNNNPMGNQGSFGMQPNMMGGAPAMGGTPAMGGAVGGMGGFNQPNAFGGQ